MKVRVRIKGSRAAAKEDERQVQREMREKAKKAEEEADGLYAIRALTKRH